LADAAHGFHEAGDAPVADADGYADGDAAEGSAGADKEGEGNGEKHADWGNHRVGDFDVPLDGEIGDVESGRIRAARFFANRTNGRDSRKYGGGR
jgi:hypothetical protein